MWQSCSWMQHYRYVTGNCIPFSTQFVQLKVSMSHGGVWASLRGGEVKQKHKQSKIKPITSHFTRISTFDRSRQDGEKGFLLKTHSAPLDFLFFPANSPFPCINMTSLIPSRVHLNKSECGYLEHTALAAWSSVVWFSSAMDYYTFGNLTWNPGN